jgi:hypothetical protein
MQVHRLDSRRARSASMILGAIAGAALLTFAAVTQIQDRAAPGEIPGAAIDTIGSGRQQAIDAYAAFAIQNGIAGEDAREARFAAEGIRRLAAALEEAARIEAPPIGRLPVADTLRAQAKLLEHVAPQKGRAQLVGDAFRSAAQELASMQRRRYPHLGVIVAEVRAAALAVRADRSLATQIREMEAFFDRSSDALRAMAGAAP